MKIDITNKNYFCWSIKLNQELDSETVNKQNVKIIDNDGIEHPISIEYSSATRTIRLVPYYDFEDNIEYTVIFDKDIATSKGKKLGKILKLSFFVAGNNSIAYFVNDNRIQRMDIENIEQKAFNNKKKKLIMLLLFLLVSLGIYLYSNQSDFERPLDEVLAEYKWNMVVTGKYLENEGFAYWKAEKLKLQKDTYRIYIVNNGTQCSDIKLDIYDDLNSNKLYKMVVIPREHITGKNVEFKCFKINFSKKELSEINTNAVNYVTGFNFDYIE